MTMTGPHPSTHQPNLGPQVAELLAQLQTLLDGAGDPPPPAEPSSPKTERLADLKARPVLSVAEVVEVSHLSLSTVRRAIKAGELVSHHVGRRVLVPTHAALDWIGATSHRGGERHGHPAA